MFFPRVAIAAIIADGLVENGDVDIDFDHGRCICRVIKSKGVIVSDGGKTYGFQRLEAGGLNFNPKEKQ